MFLERILAQPSSYRDPAFDEPGRFIYDPHFVMPISILDSPFQNKVYEMYITRAAQKWTLCSQSYHNELGF